LAILVLLGLATVLVLLRDPVGDQLLGAGVAIVVYGGFVYFVSVQFLMQRRVTEIASRLEFRRAMETTNRFHGLIKALYQLPLILLVAGILLGVLGKLSE
jgi:hypothetical protein